jgi:hypothetical protein
MLQRVQAVGQALLDLGLSVERPVAILSGNDLEHLTLALGAHVGRRALRAGLAAYSLVSQDYGKLRHILGVTTPGLVFAADAAYARPSPPCAGRHAGGADRRARWKTARGAPFKPTCWPPCPARAGGRARPGRPRHHRQVPVHLGLDQAAQGRDQHAPHDVRQPADAAPVPGLPGRGAAGAGRLAALEPHLRRQPQRRHHALQRRHAVHRRRQAHAGASPRRCATCARSRPRCTSTCPRAGGDRHRDGHRHGAARHLFKRCKAFMFAGAGAVARRCGTSCTRMPRHRWASGCASSPAWA